MQAVFTIECKANVFAVLFRTLCNEFREMCPSFVCPPMADIVTDKICDLI